MNPGYTSGTESGASSFQGNQPGSTITLSGPNLTQHDVGTSAVPMNKCIFVFQNPGKYTVDFSQTIESPLYGSNNGINSGHNLSPIAGWRPSAVSTPYSAHECATDRCLGPNRGFLHKSHIVINTSQPGTGITTPNQ